MAVIKAYKGFNKDMTCRGFQFREGETYELPEGVAAKLCESGFHACENPLDCWSYYDILKSEYHEVELDEVSGERGDDTKVCARKIRIGAKLDLKGIVRASVDFVMNSVKGGMNGATTDNGNDGAQIGSSGFGAQIGSSGYGAQIGSSGDGAKIGSSGFGAQIGSSGDGAKIGSSGDGAQIGSSGDGAQIEMTGERSVAACVGNSGKIKAHMGCWIVLSEWKYFCGKYTPVCVKAAVVDGETIKADTWYKLHDGEFVECGEEGAKCRH